LINFEDSDVFESSLIISNKITNGHQLSNPNEFQEKLIQKYKDENEYLKELVRQILKNCIVKTP
jgi:cell division protein FtsB